MAVVESRDVVFARLNALGVERVQTMLRKGESLAVDEAMVIDWLQIKEFERALESHRLQERAVEAAERAAGTAEAAARYASKSAVWTMAAALTAFATVLISIIERWAAR